MPFRDAKAALSWLYGLWVQAADVLFQKLTMRHLGSLDTVGGPAKQLTVIVTGPTSGIGLQTAHELARRGAHVILACRNAERGEVLRQELLSAAAFHQRRPKHGQAAGHIPSAQPRVEVWLLDLSSLASVHAFAERWELEQRDLHVLVNNAGIYSMSLPRQQTSDGFEMHLASNHLGHFLLTLLLLPALRRGAAALPSFGARVVSVCSAMHWLATTGMGVADPNLARQGAFTSHAAYSQSKLAQILFTRELRRRLPPNVTALALDPGVVRTDVIRTLPAWMRTGYHWVLGKLMLTPSQGARASVYCATSPTVSAEATASGGYIGSNCRPQQPSPAARNLAQAAWLWRWSAAAVHLPQKYDLPSPTL